MRKLVIATAIATLLAGITAAFADTATGAIKSIDSKAGAITLDNGRTYKMSGSMTTTGWSVGDKVRIDFENKNGANEILVITRA